MSPSETICAEYQRLISEDVALNARYQQEIGLPSQSQCGERFKFMVNSGLAIELEYTNAQFTDGVGLYRTQFPFIIRNQFPTEQEQVELYEKVLASYPQKTVVMRTLDVGGDKALPYFSIIEENPFLGWRGIRLGYITENISGANPRHG
ncbi:phosphoenolpyruvate--protein phosphotransferase [Alishewanella longhuensis]